MPPRPKCRLAPHHHQSFLYIFKYFMSVEIGKNCLVSKFSWCVSPHFVRLMHPSLSNVSDSCSNPERLIVMSSLWTLWSCSTYVFVSIRRFARTCWSQSTKASLSGTEGFCWAMQQLLLYANSKLQISIMWTIWVLIIIVLLIGWHEGEAGSR